MAYLFIILFSIGAYNDWKRIKLIKPIDPPTARNFKVYMWMEIAMVVILITCEVAHYLKLIF